MINTSINAQSAFLVFLSIQLLMNDKQTRQDIL